MSTLAPPLLSSYETAALADISYRQLDYWCRCGVIVPVQDARGSGTRRRFTPSQVRALSVCGRLAELHVGGEGRSMVGTLAAVVGALDMADVLGETPGWVVAHGGRVRVAYDAADLADVLGGTRAAIVIEVPALPADPTPGVS
jgi:hypothetical protein